MTDEERALLDALFDRGRQTVHGYVWDEYMSDEETGLLFKAFEEYYGDSPRLSASQPP